LSASAAAHPAAEPKPAATQPGGTVPDPARGPQIGNIGQRHGACHSIPIAADPAGYTASAKAPTVAMAAKALSVCSASELSRMMISASHIDSI